MSDNSIKHARLGACTYRAGMASLRLALLLLLAPLSRCWLYSSGSDLLRTETQDPVTLQCINWYGAEQRDFVSGGLDTRSCGDIANSILALGANCVRIPVSVEMVLTNPFPPASSIAGLAGSSCNATRALGVLDCQVRELTRRGLMVILDNHNSEAGWVGSYEEVPQGLWHTSKFPTRDWLASLAVLATRYRYNPLVVGIDIRNEIHDQDGTVITWGETDDPDTDWKVATALADTAIRNANPEMLVIVSGLSLSYDLRAMQDLHNYRSKYVFTTHVYTYSWWFKEINWNLILALSLLFVAGNAGAALWLRYYHTSSTNYCAHYSDTYCDTRCAITYIVAGAGLLPVYVIVVDVIWIQITNSHGCSTIAADAYPTLYMAIVGLTAVLVAWFLLATREHCIQWKTLLTSICLWNILVGVIQVVLSIFYQSYWAVLWDLRRWSSSHIPVFVGEFGTMVGDHTVSWGWLLTYINGMHYAYWALNGCTTRFGKYDTDGFGLLAPDWKTVRDEEWTRAIFPGG